MPSSPEATLFERLRERLLEGGIAPRHVGRYVGELRDHLDDLTTAGGDREAALAQLGTLDELADAALARKELRSWVARAPWAAFLVAPPILLLLVYVLGGLPLMALLLPYRGDSSTVPPDIRAAVDLLVQSVIYAAPVVVGWLMGLVALRQRVAPTWVLGGMVLIAILGGAAEIDVLLANAPLKNYTLKVSFMLAPPFPRVSPHALQTLVTLVAIVAPYLLWRRRERSAA